MTETMQTIKDLMKHQHISQRNMAEKVGVAEATMSRWINGTRNPDIQYVEKMAEVLGRNLIVGYELNWIPVSKRLPERGELVLVWYEYFRFGDYNRMDQTYGIGYQINGRWYGDVTGVRAKCIAWMPLPEPYKENAE